MVHHTPFDLFQITEDYYIKSVFEQASKLLCKAVQVV